jgi:murein DD-endopeptidase MepM/ murein hydrolase activator NlpD
MAEATPRHRHGAAVGLAALVLATTGAHAGPAAPAARLAGPPLPVASAPGDLATRVTADLRDRAAVVARTEAVLEDKRADLDAAARRRLRSLYKLSRASRPALWFEPSARGQVLRRRAAIVRVLRRDLAERAILDDEVRAAGNAAATLVTLEAIPAAPPPAPASLLRPVRGAPIVGRFGAYREGRLELARRGIELRVRPGAAVVAPVDGQIRFVGPLRGLGGVVIIDHGDLRAIVAGVDAAEPAGAGRSVQAGDPLGTASGARLGLEIRLRTGDAAGFPIDPAPLLDH